MSEEDDAARIEAFNAFSASLQRNVAYLKEQSANFVDGRPPAGLVAESDQFHAASTDLLNIFIGAIRRHRGAGMECCKKDSDCFGFEVPVLLATMTPFAMGNILTAFSIAVGRLANLPEEVPNDPLRP